MRNDLTEKNRSYADFKCESRDTDDAEYRWIPNMMIVPENIKLIGEIVLQFHELANIDKMGSGS